MHVLMSLWKVDDAATRMLMTEFYNKLWQNPSEKLVALRHAQKIVRETPGWEHPFFWSAWVLAGENW